MSSVGQAVGMVAGGVIGSFFGATIIGAQIGGMIGGYIDPPAGPKVEGPRLSDLQQQTAAYGAAIPRIYGRMATLCNVFWIENNALKEVSHTETQSAKGGGGGAETTTYAYYGTFAAGICSVPPGEAKTLGRIWLRGKLFYDPTDASLGASFENGSAEDYFTFYSGADGQLPDDRMQAALGINSTPAYRGLCYIVFKDLPLADYGNSIVGTQVKVEIISAATASDPARIVHLSEGAFTKFDPANGPYWPRIADSLFSVSRGSREITLAADGTLISDSGGGASGAFMIGTLGGATVTFELTGLATGDFKIGGSTFLQKTGGTTDEFQGAAVSNDGTRLYVLRYSVSTMYLDIYDDGMNLLTSHATTAFSYQNNLQYPYVQGADIVFCVESESGTLWYANAYAYTDPVALWQIAADGSTTFTGYIDPPTNFAGPHGSRIAMAAHDGLMYVASNGGSFSVYSRRTVVSSVDVTLASIVSAECLSSGLLDAADIDVTDLTQTVRGYKVSNTSSIRSALDPLRACWPFDVVPSGYKIKFVPRGSTSAVTIDSGELDARAAGSANGVRITQRREMATQLPRRVEVTYIDAAREYDLGPPGIAERINTDATNVEQIELPIVLTADEAQAKAETLLYLRWLERHDLEFVMPPPRLNIEPADVVTINSSDATYVCRLTETTTLPDGRIESRAKLASTTIYTPNAVGQAGSTDGQALVFGGPSRMALLDIPCLTSAMDAAGMAVGMTGYYAGWPGGTLVKSDDGWQSWQSLDGFPAPGVTIGSAVNALAAGRADLMDTANTLTAHLPNTALTSATDLQLWNGANHFAVGAHGRWEIIAAKTLTANADGSFSMSNLMRGRFGTEWAMTTHQAGDAVVHLDPALLEFVGLPISNLGVQKNYRAVSRGASIVTATDTPFTWSGVNLKPLAPVYLNGSRDVSTLDWSLTWTRRTRTGVEPFSGVAAPLGETTEAYEIEIWNSTYTTLKRTITGLTSAACNYTAAQQIADFGANQETIYVKVYQISPVVGRGYALPASIQRYMPLDPYIAFRVFGMHFNGSNGSTTFTEWSGKTFTATGNAQLTTTGMKFGTACGTFDGSGDYLSTASSADFNPGTGDYGFGGWISPNSLAQSLNSIASTGNGTSTGWHFFYTSAGELKLIMYTGAGTYNEVASSTSIISASAWNFVWWSKQGTTYRLFAGTGATATKVAEVTISGTPNPGGGLIFGRWDSAGTTGRDFNGKADDFLGYKGAPVYTANFSTPTIEFPDT